MTNNVLRKSNSAALTIHCEWVADHVIAHFGSTRVIVDTGSPVTLSSMGTLDLGPLGLVDCSPMPQALQEDLSSRLGQVDGLLGMDVLAGFSGIEFRMPTNELVLNPKPMLQLPNSTALRFERLMGVPVMQDVVINGQACNAILDTGAVVSYLPANLLEGCSEAGSFNDFYSLLDNFRRFEVSKTCMVPLTWGNTPLTVRAGEIPVFLADLGLPILGVDVIRNSILQLSFIDRICCYRHSENPQ